MVFSESAKTKLAEAPKDAKVFGIIRNCVGRLNAAAIPFAAIGSVSCFAHVGFAFRRPGDFDVVVPSDSISEVKRALQDLTVIERTGFLQANVDNFKIQFVVGRLMLLDLVSRTPVGDFDLWRPDLQAEWKGFTHEPYPSELVVPVLPAAAILLLLLLIPTGAQSLLDLSHLLAATDIKHADAMRWFATNPLMREIVPVRAAAAIRALEAIPLEMYRNAGASLRNLGLTSLI